MTAPFPRRFWSYLALAALLAPAGFAQTEAKDKEKEKPAASQESDVTKLRIEVTAGDKNVPVDSASVYVKYQKERMLGKDRMVEMNVKTNRDGVAKLPTVPRGKVLVQVIAQGWKTFGQWYDVSDSEQTIKVNLQKPPRWY